MHQDKVSQMIDTLEENGEIRLSSYDRDIVIQSFDSEDGIAFVTDNDIEFEESREAVEWAVKELQGVENIEDWE